VRPPGDAAGLAGGQRGAALKKLEDEPHAEKHVCRQDEYPREDEDGDKRQHGRVGIEQEVGAHDAGYGAAGADDGNGRERIDCPVDETCARAAERVEEQIQHVPEAVLHVVAEDIEKPAVAQQVYPTAVQNDAGQQREVGGDGRREDWLLCNAADDAEGGPVVVDLRDEDGGVGSCNSGGDHGVLVDEIGGLRAGGELKEEDGDVDGDDAVVDHGRGAGRNTVANGNHDANLRTSATSLRMPSNTSAGPWASM